MTMYDHIKLVTFLHLTIFQTKQYEIVNGNVHNWQKVAELSSKFKTQ